MYVKKKEHRKVVKSMDYKNAKIHKILNDIDEYVYIGSTCQPLSKRMSKHRQSYKATRKQHYNLYVQDTKEKKAEYDKEYREVNKEYRTKQKQQYWLNVKDEKNEERRAKYQETKHNKIHCDICNIDFVKESQYKHYKSIRHLNNLNNINE